MYKVPADVDETAAVATIDEGLQLLGNGGGYLVMGDIIPGKVATIDPGQAVRKSDELTTMKRYAPWYLREAREFRSDHGDDYRFAYEVDAEYAHTAVQDTLQDSANREVTRAALVTEYRP